MRFHKPLVALAALTTTVSSLATVSRTGRYLYANGQRFSIKGIAYQQQGTVTSNDPTGFPEPTDYIDPLADAASCTRDIPYLKQLGVNAVRVYSVNSALDHDSCMSDLSTAGIYVILDLALPVNGSINRVAPSWTTSLLDSYLGTIDTFSKYDNILAFNIGNEIVTGPTDTAAAPYIKAATRDIKAYLASKGSSALVSFSSTDGDASWLVPLAEYLACGTAATSIDIFGLNNYRWCGASTVASYSSLIQEFQNYSIPAYFSEFGCVTSPPRLWTEVQALFDDTTMTSEWSGGVAFSYFPAVGGYGIVNISSNGESVTTSDDFTRLQQQYTNVTLPSSPAQSGAGSNSQAQCPAESAAFLASTTLPPTPTSGVCQCLQQNVFSCVFNNAASANAATIEGDILNYACVQLGSLGGSCASIGGNGTTGTYGPFSVCDPGTQVSYAISQYYQLTNRQASSCDFAGNATLASTGPSSASAANAAASSCAATAFTGTTVPPQPSATQGNTVGAGTSGATPTSGSSGSKKSDAIGGFEHTNSVLTFATVALAGVLGCVAVML